MAQEEMTERQRRLAARAELLMKPETWEMCCEALLVGVGEGSEIMAAHAKRILLGEGDPRLMGG